MHGRLGTGQQQGMGIQGLSMLPGSSSWGTVLTFVWEVWGKSPDRCEGIPRMIPSNLEKLFFQTHGSAVAHYFNVARNQGQNCLSLAGKLGNHSNWCTGTWTKTGVTWSGGMQVCAHRLSSEALANGPQMSCQPQLVAVLFRGKLRWQRFYMENSALGTFQCSTREKGQNGDH